MIYTVTLNPSVDYMVEVDQVTLGDLNRTNSESKFPGGKGINVSQVLKRLDIDSTCSWIYRWFYWRIYREVFKFSTEYSTDFVKVKEDTRINVKD